MTNVSIPVKNMLKKSWTFAVSVAINISMQLHFVSVHGPRETYFVDETRRLMQTWTGTVEWPWRAKRSVLYVGRRKLYAKWFETIILRARFTRPEPGTFLCSRDPVDVHPAGAIPAGSSRSKGPWHRLILRWSQKFSDFYIIWWFVTVSPDT
jgi:hypothetical protein